MLTREQMKASLKRRKDSYDHRDFPFSITAPKVLPTHSSVLRYLTKVENQEQTGCCTAETGTTTIEAIRNHLKTPLIDLSVLFQYYTERMIQDTVDEDSGADMRTICKAGAKYGFCPTTLWPYDESKVFTKPPQNCFDEAKKILVSRYERLDSEKAIESCISQGRTPAMLGFPVWTSFFNIKKNGIMPMPNESTEQIEGGHAVTVYGYDPKYFIIRNSWGAGWGNKGDFRMPREFYRKYKADIDVWRIVSIQNK